MVDKGDDRINFDKLEKELNAAVAFDEQYWQKNDAKFRAVNQRVATYDEFRDIVLAAHLKPLEKNDRFDKIDRIQQQWNVAASKKREDSKMDVESSLAKKSQSIPKNGHEFARDWRRHSKSSVEKYEMMLNVGHVNMRKIFQSEISFGLLGEMISSLLNFTNSDISEVLLILDALGSAGRFSLSLDFLTSQETKDCQDVFAKIKTCLSAETSDSHELMLEEFQKLCTVYKMQV